MSAESSPGSPEFRPVAEGADVEFSHGPQLGLDDLIDGLVNTARSVKQAQGRLRALLHAIELVNGELDLERVLRHIAESAARLAEAKYAALGVISYEGGLERFIHVGMGRETVSLIGDLPQGRGVLGALITDPRPVRLKNLTADPRSAGFPPGHPSMESFLGVPILVRGEVFGNLYLTDSLRGEFSAEDEELVGSLAQAAGAAISNARLYDESKVRQRWLAASAEISGQLLAPSGEDPLRTVARLVAEISSADLVTVGVLVNDGRDVLVEVAVGERADRFVGQRFAAQGSLAERVVAARSPVLIRGTKDGDVTYPDLGSSLRPGPMMVVPMLGAKDVIGVLTIVREPGSAVFATSDLEMSTAFAGHASVALELARARADQQKIALLEDRDRIARDLHDHVIQQLFAIGLRLDSIATTVGVESEIGADLKSRVKEITQTIRRIRTSIFELRGPIGGQTGGLRHEVLAIADGLRPLFGFSVNVAFSGLIDTVAEDLAEDVLACVREGLTNVAKYAHASWVDVELSVADEQLCIRIADDGKGIDLSRPRSGLDNLSARALRRGGEFSVTPSHDRGTELIWKAPT